MRYLGKAAMRRIGLAAMCGYIFTIFAANWLIAHLGLVPVGFGLVAPAGVFAAGFAFTFRDIVQRTLGRPAVLAGILVGALVSALVSPVYALASCVAFLVSEAADFAVYTPFERRSWLGAVALSNTAGAVVDSVLFLWLAFGSIALVPGQVLGKSWTTLAAVTLLAGVPRLRARPQEG